MTVASEIRITIRGNLPKVKAAKDFETEKEYESYLKSLTNEKTRSWVDDYYDFKKGTNVDVPKHIMETPMAKALLDSKKFVIAQEDTPMTKSAPKMIKK